MSEFLADQQNFELLLESVFKHEQSSTNAFKALIDNVNANIFHKYHTFDVIQLISNSINEILAGHIDELKAMMLTKLLDFWIKKDENRTLGLFFDLEIGLSMINHIKYGAVQHFLHFVIITNHSISFQYRNRIVHELSPKIIQDLIQLQSFHLSNLSEESYEVLTGISSFIEQLLIDAFAIPVLSSVDEVRDSENKAVYKEAHLLKNLLFVNHGSLLIHGILEVCLKEVNNPN